MSPESHSIDNDTGMYICWCLWTDLNKILDLCLCLESNINCTWAWWNSLARFIILSFCWFIFVRKDIQIVWYELLSFISSILQVSGFNIIWILIFLALILGIIARFQLKGKEISELTEEPCGYKPEEEAGLTIADERNKKGASIALQ